MELTFAQGLNAWLDRLATLGFDARAALNPPASADAIEAAERAVGFGFPDDLRALYRVADGQPDSLAAAETSPVRVMPLFGGYDFVPLERALIEYRRWSEIYEEAGEDFDADFNDGMISARDGDPVFAEYWRPGWLPFAVDGGGNAYAVDLSPAPGGAYGQVILIGPDEDERKVLGPGLAAWLHQVALNRPKAIQREGNWAALDMESGEQGA